MSKSTLGARPTGRPEQTGVDSTEALSLLSDEYASQILCLIDDEPASARDLSKRLDVSRATVYRRLDRLEEAGLVKSSIAYDTEGHHRQRYQLRVAELSVSITGDGVDVESVGDDSEPSRERWE